jgi:uncharacterized protein
MKRLFIIHGWAGSHNEPFYQYLKKQLDSKEFEVYPLKMPKATEPEINSWVGTLSKNVGTPNKDTYFYGHSIGTQTILRYLQSIKEKIKVGGAVLTSPFVHLKPMTFQGPWKESEKSARPWLKTPLNFKKIKSHCDKFVCIFSDDDPFVPLEDKDIFEKELNAKIIIEHNKLHSPGADSVLDELREMIK